MCIRNMDINQASLGFLSVVLSQSGGTRAMYKTHRSASLENHNVDTMKVCIKDSNPLKVGLVGGKKSCSLNWHTLTSICHQGRHC